MFRKSSRVTVNTVINQHDKLTRFCLLRHDDVIRVASKNGGGEEAHYCNVSYHMFSLWKRVAYCQVFFRTKNCKNFAGGGKFDIATPIMGEQG